MTQAEDSRRVFVENVCNADVPYDRVVGNFIDYINDLNDECSKRTYNQHLIGHVVTEIEECTRLLRHRAIDPDGSCSQISFITK